MAKLIQELKELVQRLIARIKELEVPSETATEETELKSILDEGNSAVPPVVPPVAGSDVPPMAEPEAPHIPS